MGSLVVLWALVSGVLVGRVAWPSTADGGMWCGACGQHGCQHRCPRLDACYPSALLRCRGSSRERGPTQGLTLWKLGLELFLVLDVNEHDSKGECPCHSDGPISSETTKERVSWPLAVISLSGFPPRQGPGHNPRIGTSHLPRMAWQLDRGLESAPNGNRGSQKSQSGLGAPAWMALPALACPRYHQGHLDVFVGSSIMLGSL